MYAISGIVGTLYGYEFTQSLFEGVSAGSNSGLSCGVTGPAMPALMKVMFIIEMWLGRLEFMSVFAVFGFVYSIVRGR
jgi:trk system potassium uptake protein TrkH